MTITTDHPASSYGLPIFVAPDGQPIDYAAGVQWLRATLGLSTTQLAESCGVSRRTVEGWEQGRMPNAVSLNVMARLIHP